MEQLSYFDLGLLAIVALGLIGGLIGKLPRKIWRTLFTIATAIAVFIYTPKAVELVLALDISKIPVAGEKLLGMLEGEGKEAVKTVSDFITALFKEKLGDLYNIEALKTILNALPGILIFIVVFFVGGLLGCILVPAILGLFVRIFTRKAKKGTAILSLGLFGAIRGAVFAVIIASPILFLSPALKKAPQIYEAVATTKKENVTKALNMVSEDLGKSKVVEYADKFLSNSENPVGKFMVYTISKEGEETKTSYMYNDLGDITGLVASYSTLKDLNFSELDKMEPEDIANMFAELGENLNSPAVKEVVSDVLADTIGVDIDLSNVDLAAEGETIAMAMEFMNPDKEVTEEDIKDLTQQLAGSDLVKELAKSESGEGMLSSIPEETQEDMKAQLEAMKNDPDPDKQLSQEDYDTLMKLFGTTAQQGGDE